MLTYEQSECQWLLKANSLEYDLLDVPSDTWSVWVGKINQAEVSITCNTCYEEADCNLNGECLIGMCECDASDVSSQSLLYCQIFSLFMNLSYTCCKGFSSVVWETLRAQA